MSQSDWIILGITGASGILYGLRALEIFAAAGLETHLVMSRSARITLTHELDKKAADLERLAAHVHSDGDMAAPISSGSYRTRGMLIAPCSIRSLSEIACGTTSTLLTRVADLVLKERRRLVLLVRETPVHHGHLRAMISATEMGAVIMPPAPAFYARPRTLDDIVTHTIGRALDLLDIDSGTVKRWDEKSGIRIKNASKDEVFVRDRQAEVGNSAGNSIAPRGRTAKRRDKARALD